MRELMERLKEAYDIPFDEIYTKEKNVVQEVIQAQKLLKEKQSRLYDPLIDRKLPL